VLTETLPPAPIFVPSRYHVISPLPVEVKVVAAPLHKSVLPALMAGAAGVAPVPIAIAFEAADVPQLFVAVAV
jgi:hypothetical protein